MAGETLGHPVLDPAFCLLHQTALGGMADDGLERRARRHDIGYAGIEQVAIAAVAQHQPVVPVEQGEALGDALDRIDQPLPSLCDLARARLHLVEQAHVLDRDHGLVGEGGDQLDLLVGERPDNIP